MRREEPISRPFSHSLSLSLSLWKTNDESTFEWAVNTRRTVGAALTLLVLLLLLLSKLHV